MNELVAWAKSVAMAWGGPGLFAIAFLDSSFLSLPEVNDILVVLFVMQHEEFMLYYALLATLGSLAGCFVVYLAGRKGGETFLKRRFGSGRSSRAMATFQRYGLLAVLVAAIMPPPAPFKAFVLLAGVARVPMTTFALAIALGRGLRYLLVGMLAVWYGEATLRYVQDNAHTVGLIVGVLILAMGLGWVLWSRHSRQHGLVDHTAASDSSTSAS